MSQVMNTMNTQVLSRTPLTVKPRHMKFPYQEVKAANFYDNNVLKSAYLAALSATFPAGEGEFIESVRLFREQITDPELKQQVKGFIGQEAHHSAQHAQFNQMLSDRGLDANRLEKTFIRDLEWSIKGRSPAQRLAFTVAFEHLTAVMAHDLLTNPSRLKGMVSPIDDLMRWHAIEEIEHKSVAFDVYMQTVGSRKLLHRAMKLALVIFSYRMMKYMVKLLWWSRTRPRWSDIKGYWSYMYGKGGLVRAMSKPVKQFFKPDFHPWDHDDSELVEMWRRTRYKAEYDAKAFKETEASAA